MRVEERVRLCNERRHEKEVCSSELERCRQRINEAATLCSFYAASTRVVVRRLQKMRARLASLMLQCILGKRRKRLADFQTSVLEYNHASQMYQCAMRSLDALHSMAPATPVELPDEIVAIILLYAGNMRANSVCRQWCHVMRTSPSLITLRRQEFLLARQAVYRRLVQQLDDSWFWMLADSHNPL